MASLVTLFAEGDFEADVTLWTDPEHRRWAVWGVLAAAFLLVNLHRLSTAVLADRLARAFAATAAELGTLHAAFFVVYAPMQVIAGVLADRAGIRTTASAGAALMSLGAVAFGLAGSYPVAFGARVVTGLGGSVIFIATLRFCANWYRPDEFATMNGMTIAAAGLGGIMATTPLAVAVTEIGWRAVVTGLGVAGLAFAAAVYVLARDTPADAGLEPIENVPSMPSLTFREVLANAWRVLQGRETWLAGLLLFAITGVNITVIGLWGVPYLVQTHELSVTKASTFTLLGSVGLMLGPPLVGRLSDSVGRRTELILGATLVHASVFGVLALIDAPPLPVVAGVLFLAGFNAGGFMLAYPVVKERYDTAASGVATGAVNAIAFSGAAVFPTAMGVILDIYWTGETMAGARVYTESGYQVAFGLASLSGVIALGFAAWLHLRVRDTSPTAVAA